MYFKHVKFTSGEKWCDGGLRRNNTVNEAVAEVSRQRVRNKDTGCLIGTGIAKVTEVNDNLAKFLKLAVAIITDSEAVAEDFATSHLGQELIKSKRYFRFSVPQGMQDLQLDE